MATLKITASSKKTLDKLKGYVKLKLEPGGLPIGLDIKGELEKLKQEETENISVSFNAHQHGGNEVALVQAIPEKLYTCNWSNFETCVSFVDDATRYAKTTFLDSLLNKPENWVPIRQVTEKYADSLPLIKLAPVELSEGEKKLLDDAYVLMHEKNQRVSKDFSDANSLLKNPLILASKEAKASLEKIVSATLTNRQKLLSSSKKYQGNYKDCIKSASDSNFLGLVSYDEDFRNAFEKLEFENFCQVRMQRAVALGAVDPEVAKNYLKGGMTAFFHDSGEIAGFAKCDIVYADSQE
jgi:hypothetical protein